MTARELFTEYPAPAKRETADDMQALHPRGQPSAPGTLSSAAGEASCGTCGDWTEGKFGFGQCEHMPTWRSTSPRATCSFSPSKWVAIDAAVIAKREAQTGIDQAAAAADRKHRGWTDQAFEFIKTYATNMKGRQFIGHDIVAASCARGILQPENSKAWGQPIQRAARAGVLKRVGFAPDPNRHTNPVPLWEAC